MAETDSTQSGSALWHLRGAEGDHLTERSEGRKLPQQMPRCPRHTEVIEDPSLGGASGGMQGGAAKGASPITGPGLLRAAQASQTPPDGGSTCPKGRKYYHSSGSLNLAVTQASPIPPGAGILCPKGYERNYYELSKPFLK